MLAISEYYVYNCFMKFKKVIFLGIILLECFLWNSRLFALQGASETILYDISPLGYSEYRDMGSVEFLGNKFNLVVFKTRAAGFEDTEKIYSDPASGLPVKVERFVSMWFGKEYLSEEYDSHKNTLSITKFEHGKKTRAYLFHGKGPIHNAVLLPFSLRKVPDLGVGWSSTIRLPEEFKVKIVSVEDITVPAGKFKAYHIVSNPPKFEIWISKDELRLPLKIKGLSGFSYTLMMQSRTLK